MSTGGRTSADAGTGRMEAAIVEEHLRNHAGSYWRHAEMAEPHLELLRIDQRSAGRLYWYSVTVDAVSRSVIVKTSGPSRSHPGRLRLAHVPERSDRLQQQYEALRSIDAHFRALGDDRVGHAPILDRVDAVGGIVMERVDGTPMTGLLQRHRRLGRGRSASRLLNVTRHAGVWLREFHRVPVAPSIVHRARRDEFVEWLDRYASHVGRHTGRAAHLAAVARYGRDIAEAVLPEALPIAVAHSDFAKRNVIVQESDRVVVLDTLAYRHAPVYEDLASFMVGLRFGRLQLQTYGLAFAPDLLAAIEGALLAGYYRDAAPPVAQFRVYELLTLLDRWAAVLTWGSRGAIRRTARAVANRLLARELDRAIARLD